MGEASGSVKISARPARESPIGLLLEFMLKAGFLAECEGGSDLDAGGTEAQGFFKFSRLPVGTGQPERQPQRADFLQLRDIARAIDRFALGTELHGAARRRVMTSGGFAFDDEAVHAAVGFARQRHGQRG